MIVVTGAYGFIGSCMVAKLNKLGRNNLLLVDDFSKDSKTNNLKNKKFNSKIDRDEFIEKIHEFESNIKAIIHLGARTDTTEFDVSIFNKLNLNYSKKIWEFCTKKRIPLIYASSAATYGNGEFGYSDSHDIVSDLKPLNPYGDSKNDFDKWVLNQEETPPFWAGLKFFNVYGPNENHKGRMASVIWHCFNQIQKNGEMKLFASHNPNFEDGGQLRDFVYVKDVVEVISFLLDNQPISGLYNLGTGKARTFKSLAEATFHAMSLKPNISFIPTPEDIRDKYQYFTEAKMSKLIDAGYKKEFSSLEKGIEDYVKNYLVTDKYL